MFYYLNGEITLMEGNLAVVDCGGVGYACRTTSYTLSKLRVGQTAKLFTYCNIREDAFDIYGFSTRDELRCFELLLGVTGVGPKAAIAILSSTSPERFMLAIMTQDEKSLTAAQGVGKKLAQRIILELKDKLARESAATGLDFSGGNAGKVNPFTSKAGEAAAALAVLGYSAQEAAAALKDLDTDALSLEELIRQALKRMAR